MFYILWDDVICSQSNSYNSSIVKDKNNGSLISLISTKTL